MCRTYGNRVEMCKGGGVEKTSRKKKLDFNAKRDVTPLKAADRVELREGALLPPWLPEKQDYGGKLKALDFQQNRTNQKHDKHRPACLVIHTSFWLN